MRLLDRLQLHATNRADSPAYVDVATAAVLPWRALRDRVAGLASHLESRLPRESVVLIRCANGLDFPVALLATLASGCVAFPISVESPAMELHALALQAGATAVMTSCAETLDGLPAIFVCDPSTIAPESMPLPVVPAAGAKTRLLLLSSGSTGKPKIVCRSGDSVDAVCDQMCRSIGIGADDRVLATVPLCHSYGIEHGLLAPVWAGATTHLCRGLDLSLIKKELSESGITLLPGVPSMYEMLANLSTHGERFPGLRAAYSAGAPLPASVANSFFQRFGVHIGQLYGATEIGSVTYSDPNGAQFEPASVGGAMPGVTLRITSASDDREAASDPVPIGKSGRVWVSAGSMFNGYLGESGSPVVDGFYPTGDLGRVDPAGNLFITGRARLLIDVGGLKVNPLEVEEVLMQHQGIAECVVVPVRQSETVLRIKAIVVPRDPANPPPIDKVRQFARDRLASYKVPRLFEVRGELPRTATGKVLRHLVEA